MTEWQPIATAPKDGTKVLGWSPHAGITPTDPFFRVVVMWWRKDRYPDSTRPWRSAENDSAIDDPTHWMPLPEPPQAAAAVARIEGSDPEPTPRAEKSSGHPAVSAAPPPASDSRQPLDARAHAGDGDSAQRELLPGTDKP